MILKKNKGFTLMELMIVIAAIAILGTILSSMMHAGGLFYKKSYTTYNGNSEARIAVSYITTKIRQNDVSGAINASDNKLIITTGNGKYTIGVIENKLMETETVNGTDRASKVIAKLEDFQSFVITKTGTTIEITVKYTDGNVKLKELNEKLSLRSAT